MDASAPPAPQGLETSPLNFIYACSVCCATFADAYEGHDETVQGLSDGINPKERLVTKLYLGSCCHVFCGDHIEGGGPPFHPAGQKPKAPCPVCAKDKGDNSARDLYSIRGFHKNEHDPAIPPVWFKAPPIKLDGNSREMEALRFQYLALVRYCQTSYRQQKPAAAALVAAQHELATVRNCAAEDHSEALALQQENKQLRALAQQAGEVNSLRAEVQRLQHLERDVDQFTAEVEAFRRLKADVRDLDTFRRNKSAILQHLKLVPKLVEQNTRMKERLGSVGFAMAMEPVPNYSHLTPENLDEIESICDTYPATSIRYPEPSSSHTAGRSAPATGNEAVVQHIHPSDRPSKRQRVESPLPGNMPTSRLRSRDTMPPPSKPLSRMRSMRKILPNLRKKFSNGRAAPNHHQRTKQDVQMYDNRDWQGTSGGQINESATSSSHQMRSETPYMTGALPVEFVSRPSPLGTSTGVDGNASDFTFRASSPVKMTNRLIEHQPVQLPTDPSYLHMMDGLSHDNGFDLGLKDPRKKSMEEQEFNRFVTRGTGTAQNLYQTREPPSRSRDLGHAFLHQPPNASTRAADQHQRTSPPGKPTGFFHRAQYDSMARSTTPVLNQFQQPSRKIENVFKSFRRLSVTETPGCAIGDRME
ncbi:hypothetical protein N0V94_001581 [Neodidymelliopsis sp. IMI 364377]|nr:hypothetical protein N0V94_001581 [Neodidymelliopsis sp. IMI 364377]